MIDLQKYCARPDHHREYLRQPFAHKGYRYGTNGHILVRVPSPGDIEATYPHKPAATIDSMFAGIHVAQYQPLPAFTMGAQCTCCAGKGEYFVVVCTACKGTGSCPTRGNEFDCAQCSGNGEVQSQDSGTLVECFDCNGHGRLRIEVAVGEATFDSNYLGMIADLPGLLFGTQGAEQQAHFTFDGGDGLLMPIRPDWIKANQAGGAK